MREAGAGDNEVQAVEGVLDIVNVLNIGGTDASRKAAVESLLKIAGKLEGKAYEQEETE